MNPVHFQSTSCEWETPQELYDALNEEFHFTLDPCATQKIISAKSITQRNRTDLHRTGTKKQFSAIRLMAESLQNG